MKSPRLNAGSEATTGGDGAPEATAGGETSEVGAAAGDAGAGLSTEATGGGAAPQNGQAGTLSEMRLPHAAHGTSTCPPIAGESSHNWRPL